MSILYYLRVMQFVVEGIAWVMQRTMGLSGAEALSTAANIFVGQTEAPLIVKPYLASMTRSELMCIMIGGFATIAGGVLAAYVGMGIDAGHLMTASVIAAPAGVVISKILEPEKETPKTMGHVRVEAKAEGANVIEAAANGASEGLLLALNVAAMLLAFLALIAMLDGGVQWVGTWFGFRKPDELWSLGAILGWIFRPIAWVMGIPSQDCARGGELLGLKMVANEFVAYGRLGEWLVPPNYVELPPDVKVVDGQEFLSSRAWNRPPLLHPRTIVIMSYALCGFSNFGSIGIQLGGIGAMAPQRKGEIAQLGLRAMLGGTLACCMTGCVAGVLIGEGNYHTAHPTQVPVEIKPQDNPDAVKPFEPADKVREEKSNETTVPADGPAPVDAPQPDAPMSGLFQLEALRHQLSQRQLPPRIGLLEIDEQHHQAVRAKFRDHLQARPARKHSAAARDGNFVELA